MWLHERVLAFIQDLRSSASIRMCIVPTIKTVIKKGDATDFIGKKNTKSAISKLRKNRQSQRSVPEGA
jgi:hypothetical protein